MEKQLPDQGLKRRHPGIGTVITQPRQGQACSCFVVRFCLRDLPASCRSQPVGLSAKGSSLLDRSGTLNFGSIASVRRYLRIVLRDNSDELHSITPCRSLLGPPTKARGRSKHGSVLSENFRHSQVNSQRKSTPWSSSA
jgi:hypothetical protein